MDWVNKIPAARTEDGDIRLKFINHESKTVKEIAPALTKVADDMIASKFEGILN
jgi:hypothetical protein